jgi:assimilatory nitrate reductase catalytic subunit
MFRAADRQPPPAALLQAVEAILGLTGPSVLRYVDAGRGQHRAMRLALERQPAPPASQPGSSGSQPAARPVATLQAFLLGGDISAEGWIRTLLQEELPAQAYGRQLLRPGADVPAAVAGRSRQVCACFDVAQASIVACLQEATGDEEQRLARLQQHLRCGTNCGSCLPELRRLLRESRPLAAEELAP